MLEAYEIFAPENSGRSIAIIKGENIPLEGGKTCGNHGIASPEFFYDELKKYGAHYIDPYDVLDLNKINKFKIIINPYGEDYFLADRNEIRDEPTLDTIKKFLELGGIWVHTGGYPFYRAVFLKTGELTSTAQVVSENFGLIIRERSGGNIIPSATGIYLIGDKPWKCKGSRNLENSTEVYAVVETEKGKLNILSSINIGKGKFIHYGGIHAIYEESRFAAKAVCKLIKYYVFLI
ncbi:MAG: hypothetical protein OIN90_01930 [Candidatus Methanoperedens sp.]|nr:hypothetical protein [Candidatus Methanoperedens sp.]